MSLKWRDILLLIGLLTVALPVLLLALAPQPEPLWQFHSVGRAPLGRLGGMASSVLVPEGRRTHHIDIFLRHNHQTEALSLKLAVELQHARWGTIYADTLDLPLASSPGLWLGSGFLEKELQLSLPDPVSIPYAGLYRLSVYPVDQHPILGVTTVGVRLR